MSTPESATSSSISVAILCGGMSRRFGSEKAMAMAGERPLCQWIMDRLAGVTDDMFLQMAPGAIAPVDLPVNHDVDPGGGPKSGIHGALIHARHPRVFVVGSDMPNVDPRLVGILARSDGRVNANNDPLEVRRRFAQSMRVDHLPRPECADYIVENLGV